MNTTMDINNKLHNLELANNNFKSIIIKPNNEKFDYLDRWLLKTSILFKKENDGIDKKIFPKFKCGTIIRVDFGINQGAELSKPHYAIVLDKFDNTKNQSIAVVPLTSKNGKNCIPLKNLINDEHIKRLNKNLNELNEKIKEAKEKKEINQIKKEMEYIKSKIDFYASYKKKHMHE